jgi:hypothetical protein
MKSLPPSGQFSRQSVSQNIKHGLPQCDLQIGPGFPGLHVTLGNTTGTTPVVPEVVVVVGCDAADVKE